MSRDFTNLVKWIYHAKFYLLNHVDWYISTGLDGDLGEYDEGRNPTLRYTTHIHPWYNFIVMELINDLKEDNIECKIGSIDNEYYVFTLRRKLTL